MHSIAPALRQFLSLPQVLSGSGSISGRVLAASSVLGIGLAALALLHLGFAMDVQRGLTGTPVAQTRLAAELKLRAVHQAHRGLILSAVQKTDDAGRQSQTDLAKTVGHRLVVLSGGLFALRDAALSDAVNVMNSTGLELAQGALGSRCWRKNSQLILAHRVRWSGICSR